MTRFQLLFVLVLAAVIAAGAIFFGYDAVFPHRRAAARVPPPVAYVPPIVRTTERARTLRADGKLAEAQQLLRKGIRLAGSRPEAKAARELLGEINTEMFFSKDSLFGKTEYVVNRGDTLWRIARKLDSSPDRIIQTNNMDSTLIQPGERLLVPNDDFTVTIDLPNSRAVVHHGDGFFKQYPIVDINLPHTIRSPVTTRVTATTYHQDGALLRKPTPEERAASTPWIHLARGGYVLYGVSENEGVGPAAVELGDNENGSAENTAPDVPRRGIALLREDLEELQMLIDRGTPVTIIGSRGGSP